MSILAASMVFAEKREIHLFLRQMSTGYLCYTVGRSRPVLGNPEGKRKGRRNVKVKMICMLIIFIVALQMLVCPVCAQQVLSDAGGIHILKTDLTGKPLEDASFQIVRELDDGELTDHTVEKKMVKIGEENRIMAVEKFWSNRNMTGQLQTYVTTDRYGRGAAYGLPYGTYYLVETKAPEGFNRITEPIRLSIHKYSHLTEEDGVTDDKGSVIDNTLHIINVRYTLPDTGNWGILQLTAAGIGIVFSSAALILLNWRRWG